MLMVKDKKDRSYAAVVKKERGEGAAREVYIHFVGYPREDEWIKESSERISEYEEPQLPAEWLEAEGYVWRRTSSWSSGS